MRSRRMTLGPVNPNRAPSLVGGGTPSADTRKKPAKGRASMLPRMAGGRESLVPPSPVPTNKGASRRKSVAGDARRRSSVGGDRRQSFLPPPAPRAKTDPRPVTDKSFQSSCIKRLLEYLRSCDYGFPISTKSLTRPSGKDFQNIVTFMLRRIDPTFRSRATMKFEDEVAMNFKALGYPFPISKTALVAAGSPHTWPTLLAALTWLMELLLATQGGLSGREQQEHREKPFESLEELEQRADKAFFRYLSAAYRCFLSNDKEQSEQLEQELYDRFNEDNMFIQQEIERVVNFNDNVVQKINQLGQQSQDLPELEKKRQDYVTDLEQFHDLVKQMNEHKEALDEKVKQRTAELSTIDQELQSVTTRVNDLKEKIQTQTLSVDDVRKMKSEQTRLGEAMNRVVAMKEEHSKNLLDKELELTKLTDEVESTTSISNSKFGCLSSVLPQNFKISLNARNAQEQEQRMLLGVNIQSEVVPTLSSCKTEYDRKVVDARADHQELLDQVEGAKASLTEAMDEHSIVEEKKTKSEELLSREREEQEGSLEVRLREVKATEAKIASARDPVALEEAIAGNQRQLVNLEALKMKHQEENVAKKKAFQDEIDETVHAGTEHVQHTARKLAQLDQYILQKKASIGSVEFPSALTFGN